MNAFVSGRMLPGTEVDPFALFDGAHHGLGFVARDRSNQRGDPAGRGGSVRCELVNQIFHLVELVWRETAEFLHECVKVGSGHHSKALVLV